jgi:tetratricopeptide (TPR) repeat protein
MKNALSILLVCLGLCLGQALHGQAGADSLWQIANDEARHDTIRLAAMQRLGYLFVHNDPDSAYAIAARQLAFAQEKDLPGWQARSLNVMGLALRMQSDYSGALQRYEQGIELLEKVGDRNYMSAVYGNMGDLYRLQSNFPKAIECINQSLKLAEETGDRKKAADSYVSIATIYYDDPGDQHKVLEYLQKAQAIYEDLMNEAGLSFVYGNLAAVWLEWGDYDKALAYSNKALTLQEKRADNHGAATSLFNRAAINTELERYDEALADFERATRTFRELGDQEGIADVYYATGDLWIRRQRYALAVNSCGRALEIAREIGGPNLREADACHCLYIAHQRQGNYRQAIAYLEQYVAVKDSLLRNETAEKLRRMELERQSVADSLAREKEKQALILAHQEELNQKNRIRKALLAGGMIVLLMALAFMARMLYFQRNAAVLSRKTQSLEKQQLIQEITLLRTQVNPHFLFNSLSILSALVHVDPDLSEKFIDQLSRSYRYILEQKEQSLVTLRTELEFIHAYAFLLKIRFEKKFDLRISVPDEYLDTYKIAPLTLQLLIENAVKHNRMSVKEPLVVEVSVGEGPGLLVSNRLQPRAASATSTGTGLQNIVNRYALLTDRPVWAGETEGMFVVKTPLLR